MGKKQLPRGIRNNNPGNLDSGSPWQGLTTGSDPRFCTFLDPAFGIRALAVTLITYHDKRKANNGTKIDTITEIIERWAPPQENDTKAYIKFVSKMTGIGADEALNLHDYNTLRPIVEAIIRHENGKGPFDTANTWYSDDVLEEGLRRAGVIRSPDVVATIPATKETAGAAITAGIGLAQVAEVAPQIQVALQSSEKHLTSGDWVQIVFGILTVAVAVFIAWSQIRKYQGRVV
ncbi:hypothetical protein MWH03_00085 [Klebsiella pneumoniae]|nr:hypothetical protein [Klebsiella pneumoniae]